MKFRIGDEVKSKKGFEVAFKSDMDMCFACKNPRFFINKINYPEDIIKIEIRDDNFNDDNLPCICHEWTKQEYVELEDDGSF